MIWDRLRRWWAGRKTLKLTAVHEAEWANAITMRWEGTADNGTLLVFQDGHEIERHEGLNMDSLCAICGVKLGDDEDCKLVEIRDVPELVCAHHDTVDE